MCIRDRDHPLTKQTYIDLKHNVTLAAERLQSKPIPVERLDLRRIQKHLVLISQLDHIYHPYLSVGLLWEKGDILEIDHTLWYMQEFIPGRLRLIRLYHQYRAYICLLYTSSAREASLRSRLRIST